jgi:Na+/proline symporter
MSAYQTGTLIGMIAVGLLLGGFTLQQGKKLGQEALGWGGFAACVAGAFVAGLLVSGPMALLFNWLIRRAASKAPPAWPEAGPESVRR